MWGINQGIMDTLLKGMWLNCDGGKHGDNYEALNCNKLCKQFTHHEKISPQEKK